VWGVLAVSDLLPFLVIGIATGSVYGLAAMGLVVTYKTSGIFNFAHGAVAAAAAFAFYEFRTMGLPWPVALFLAVVALPPLVALLLERIARLLAQGTVTVKIVGTVGLQLTIVGTLLAVYGGSVLDFPDFMPRSTVTLFDVVVAANQLISAALAAAAAIGFFIFFRVSPMGVRMRAVVDDPELLALSGSSPFAVRAWGWMIGTWFAALSGVLLAPAIGLDAFLLTLLVVQAFGAAAVGRFSSLPMTYLGGLLVGVLAAVTSKLVSSSQVLAELPTAVPFLVLLIVLLVTPRKKLVEIGSSGADPMSRPVVRPRAARALYALTFLGAAVLPFVVGTKLPVYSAGLVLVLVFYSLHLLVRTSGQISLAHAGFVAVGSAAFSHLAVDAGLPWLLSVLLAGAVAIPVGLVVAVPAIRLSGIYLALATFGFALLLQRIGYRSEWMFGPTNTLPAPRPEMFASDTAFYYVLLIFAVACGFAIWVIGRTRLGRLLRALGDAPATLSTLGLAVNITRLTVFAVSAFIAGVGGALYASQGYSATGVPFDSFVSLLWLAVLYLAPGTGSAQPIIAALSLAVVPAYIDNDAVNKWNIAFFGLCAVLVSIYEATRTSQRSAAPDAQSTAVGSRTADRLHAGSGPVAERIRAASEAAAARTGAGVGVSVVVSLPGRP
jgi:branched-subunit amino acid ABC-type transport system permease component